MLLLHMYRCYWLVKNTTSHYADSKNNLPYRSRKRKKITALSQSNRRSRQVFQLCLPPKSFLKSNNVRFWVSIILTSIHARVLPCRKAFSSGSSSELWNKPQTHKKHLTVSNNNDFCYKTQAMREHPVRQCKWQLDSLTSVTKSSRRSS